MIVLARDVPLVFADIMAPSGRALCLMNRSKR
jgi:hypothetical protein